MTARQSNTGNFQYLLEIFAETNLNDRIQKSWSAAFDPIPA
jgi:hypothetical protein